MEIIYRPATQDDYDGICTLCEQIDALHRDNLPHRFQEPDGPARERQYVMELLDNENIRLFVAEQSGQLVGFVHVVVLQVTLIPIMLPRSYGVIDSLIVAPDYRNQGIGTALMDHAERWARQKGAAEIELNVYEFNTRAQAFYQNMGYTTLSKRMSKNIRHHP
jgi:ribosomal protein S18 acetylase RimI-like enzyme